MPEETKKDKPDDKKGDAKFRDLEPTKDAKGGGGLKPASGGGGLRSVPAVANLRIRPGGQQVLVRDLRRQ